MKESRIQRLQRATKREEIEQVQQITRELAEYERIKQKERKILTISSSSSAKDPKDPKDQQNQQPMRPASLLKWPHPPCANRTVFLSIAHLERTYQNVPRDVLESALFIFDTDRKWYERLFFLSYGRCRTLLKKIFNMWNNLI